MGGNVNVGLDGGSGEFKFHYRQQHDISSDC